MMETAARQRVVTQMGTQIHNTGENYRQVVEIVQAGTLGPIRRVHVWCNRRPDEMFLAKENSPPPQGLHYDLWLGPAPQRGWPPYRQGTHPLPEFDWRWWWDYGGGVLADMGCHFALTVSAAFDPSLPFNSQFCCHAQRGIPTVMW